MTRAPAEAGAEAPAQGELFAPPTGDATGPSCPVQRGRDPAAELVEDALGDEVTAALASLAEDYRRVVILADLQGVRYGDIAVRLGVPIGTVMSRLFRARRQLEERLSGYAASAASAAPRDGSATRPGAGDSGSHSFTTPSGQRGAGAASVSSAPRRIARPA